MRAAGDSPRQKSPAWLKHADSRVHPAMGQLSGHTGSSSVLGRDVHTHTLAQNNSILNLSQWFSQVEAVQDDGGCSSTFLCASTLLTAALISHSVQICWGGEKEGKTKQQQQQKNPNSLHREKKGFLTDSLWLETAP